MGRVPGGRSNERGDRERGPRSARGTRAPPRPGYLAASTYTVPPHGHPRRFCGKTGRLSDVEGRWGRMDAAVITSERDRCATLRPGPGRDEV